MQVTLTLTLTFQGGFAALGECRTTGVQTQLCPWETEQCCSPNHIPECIWEISVLGGCLLTNLCLFGD